MEKVSERTMLKHAIGFEQAAMQGHITTQVDLAEMYRLGKGGKKDLEQAAKWYIKAAEQGDAYAQY